MFIINVDFSQKSENLHVLKEQYLYIGTTHSHMNLEAATLYISAMFKLLVML